MKLIIFDMDGTLIDSGDGITNTINHVRSKLGLGSFTKEFMLKAVNDPSLNGAEFFYNSKTFTSEHKELFENFYETECVKDIYLYSGIENLLETLKDDYIFAVATNAGSISARKMLSHLGIIDRFSYIIGSDMVSQAKPMPDMVLQTLSKLNIQKEDAMLVGDSLKDKHCAINAEIQYALVNWGFSNFDEKHVVNNVQELKNKILNNT
jgi:phosphoglycolate phosphatase